MPRVKRKFHPRDKVVSKIALNYYENKNGIAKKGTVLTVIDYYDRYSTNVYGYILMDKDSKEIHCPENVLELATKLHEVLS